MGHRSGLFGSPSVYVGLDWLNALNSNVLAIRGNKKRKFSFVDIDVLLTVDDVALPAVIAVFEFRYIEG